MDIELWDRRIINEVTKQVAGWYQRIVAAGAGLVQRKSSLVSPGGSACIDPLGAGR
jgi:hypothetical protein